MLIDSDTRILRSVVNVASVPHLSPFRYPGGKTWLVPRAIRWLQSMSKPNVFVEPFAGGGSISLAIAEKNLAKRIVMVEKDEQVAAVWQTILQGDAQWLADAIASFEPTPESVQACLRACATSVQEHAFQTLVKNRTFRGGILAPGSSPIKLGENGKGIRSRWYPETLRKRIMNIAALSERITFINGDGMSVMEDYLSEKQAAFFIDPPYTAAGKRAGSRLYTHAALDHEKLFALTAKLAGEFIMTYDDAEDVRTLGNKHHFQIRTVAMKNTHHAEMTELLLGRDLSWI